MFGLFTDYNEKSSISTTLSILKASLYIIFGVLIMVIPSDVLQAMFYICFGLFVILLNILPCIYYFLLSKVVKGYLVKAILALVTIILGFILMFMNIVPAGGRIAFDIILAIWFIAVPVTRIVLSEDHKSQAKKEIPWFVIGLFLFFIGFDSVFNVARFVFGTLIILTGIVLIILAIILSRPKKKDNEVEVVKNVKPDGVIIDADVKEL